MTKEFAGKVALVTGGSRGIGRATCRLLAQGGAAVAVNYASDEKGANETRRLVEAEGAKCTVVRADVSDEGQVAAMVSEVEQALGPVDMLVANAGWIRTGTHEEVDFATWKRHFTINTDGVFLPVWALKDKMIARGDGRIVCISSIAALRPRPRQIAYGAAKAAVIGLVRSCGEAFAPAVRINCIAPGLIETDMSNTLSPEVRKTMIDQTPMKRIGRPEEIAELAAFLLSDRSSFTTGQTMVASGGRVTLP